MLGGENISTTIPLFRLRSPASSSTKSRPDTMQSWGLEVLVEESCLAEEDY